MFDWIDEVDWAEEPVVDERIRVEEVTVD